MRPNTITKGMRFPAEPLTHGEVVRLVAAARPRDYNKNASPWRNYALFVMLWRCGLRVGEALALRPADVDIHEGTVRVLHGKGDRDRTVGLDEEGCLVQMLWMERRTEHGINGAAPLYCTTRQATGVGKPLRQKYVRWLMKRLGRRAGIEKRMHPHGLRHTMATELAREGMGLRYIQAQLGHKNPSTTDLYLARIAPTDLVAKMREREW